MPWKTKKSVRLKMKENTKLKINRTRGKVNKKPEKDIKNQRHQHLKSQIP